MLKRIGRRFRTPERVPERSERLRVAPQAPRACNAPFVSLHLDPTGRVRVCELNSLVLVGRIPEERLISLWNNERTRRIRRSIDSGDFSSGCESCAPLIGEGHRALSHAAYYDQVSTQSATDPEWPLQLELSLSNTCNLECIMCNGDYSSAIRSRREGLDPIPAAYDEQFFEDLQLFLSHLERVAFIGGEPFLCAATRRVFRLLAVHNPAAKCAITTNGTVFNRSVEQTLDTLRCDVSISIDGANPATYARIRRGSDLQRVLGNVDRFQRLADHVSLNFCLMTVNWQEFGDFLALAQQRDLDAHVNVVTAPHRFSLYRLSRRELDDVLGHLEGQRQRSDLGKNARLLDQELDRLRAHANTLDSEVPIEIRSHGVDAMDFVAAHANHLGVGVIALGDTEHIIGMSPAPESFLGLDLSTLMGGHLASLIGPLELAFGPIISSSIDPSDGGLEIRHITMSTASVTTHLLAVLGPGGTVDGMHGTSFWYLSLDQYSVE